jgi:hypothetical protein
MDGYSAMKNSAKSSQEDVRKGTSLKACLPKL